MCSPKCQQDAEAMAATISELRRDAEIMGACIDELRKHLSNSTAILLAVNAQRDRLMDERDAADAECAKLRERIAELQPAPFIHRGPIC